MYTNCRLLNVCLCLFITNFILIFGEADSQETEARYRPPPLANAKARELKSKVEEYLKVKRPVLSARSSAAKEKIRFIVGFSKEGIRRFKRRAKLTRFRDIYVEEEVLASESLAHIHTFEWTEQRVHLVRADGEDKLLKLEKAGFLTFFRDIPVQLRETAPNDQYFPYQWALRNTGQSINVLGDGGIAGIDMHATFAWDYTTSSNAVVAIADSGIQTNHPDLSANIWVNSKEIAGNNIDDDANGWKDDVNGASVVYFNGAVNDTIGHGTNVAGIIAGRGNNNIGMSGVAWNAKVLPIKLVTDSGQLYIADWAIALDYATMMKQRYDDSNPNNGGANIKVINFSLGASISCIPTGDPRHPADLFVTSARRAGQAGILLVSAASNDAYNHDLVEDIPTTCDLTNLITVANMTRFGVLQCSVATVNGVCPSGAYNGSGYGANTVDIAAPGNDIITTDIGSGYDAVNGTSFAAPQVSGVAALIAGVNPSLTAESIRSLIISTASPLAALNNKVVADGMLDARAVIPGITALLPGFTAHPGNLNQTSGTTATFSITPSGASPRTFQWYKNDVLIAGATAQSYSISNVTTANNGTYKCKLSNQYGSAMSNGGTLTVSASTMPVITTHPAAKSAVVGQSTTFSCAASGTPLPTYQWQKNNVNIPGATSPTYSFSPVIGDHGKIFRCVATNSAGSAFSNGATLAVTYKGDFNKDGCVNGSDFLQWQREFGSVVTPYTLSDASGDGNVDAADYTLWRDNYGACRP